MNSIDITDSIVERFRKVGTATVYRAVNELGFPNCFMKGVNCYTPDKRIVGRARTLSYVPYRPDIYEETNLGENAPEYRAMSVCGPNDVLIVGTHRITEAAIAGDMILFQLKMVQAEGLITDGAIRDLEGIKSYGYGIFAGNITPAGRSPAITSFDYNIDTVCGGITIRPGDIIVAENYDIVCVPKQIANKVIDWVEKHEKLEEVVKEMIIKDNCAPGRYYNKETFDKLEENGEF